MRVTGWERLLNDHIANPMPFQWGQNDCALWCADWILKATGQDFATDWRGKYATEDELNTVMAALGIKSYEQIADETGFKRIHPAFAQRGDVLLHPQGPLGICNGAKAYFLTENGRTDIAFTKCVTAWRIS